MPHESARGVFYPGIMLILTPIYIIRGVSWWSTPTEKRVAGIDWVAGWLTHQDVAVMWWVTAAAALLSAVLALRTRRRTALIVASMVTVVVPMIIALWFFGSTLVWLLDPDPMLPPEPAGWRDLGSPSGWVTGWEYMSWSLVALWALMVHTGAARIVSRVWSASRRAGKEDREWHRE